MNTFNYGKFTESSQPRLELTYDYENSCILSFKRIAAILEPSKLIDVGANIGVYSVFCSDLPCLNEVHAFEPSSDSFDILEENFRLQDVRKFRSYRLAASDRDSKVKFKIVSPLSGANAVAKDNLDQGNIVEIDAVAIDNVLDFQGERIAIKIDVEGHEVQALRGMRNMLSKNFCYLQVEALEHSQFLLVKSELDTLGYDYVFSLRDDHLFLHRSLERYVPEILAELSQAIAVDLSELLNLRRQNRRKSKASKPQPPVVRPVKVADNVDVKKKKKLSFTKRLKNKISRFLGLEKPSNSVVDNKKKEITISNVVEPIAKKGFIGSAAYWETRYRSGRDSGAGSYNRLAEFKANFLNSFVADNAVSGVIEFGCGDGNQLSLARYPNYVGYDVSDAAIETCKAKFATDSSKSFFNVSEYTDQAADMSMSLDVIYHLVEDDVFNLYMRRLFNSSQRFVVIYSSDVELPQRNHVRQRKFTNWVAEHCLDWSLVSHVANRYPYDENDTSNTSFADFFVYQRN